MFYEIINSGELLVNVLTLRATSQRLDVCGYAINNAALRFDDATTLVPFDHVGDQDVSPGARRGAPAHPPTGPTPAPGRFYEYENGRSRPPPGAYCPGPPS